MTDALLSPVTGRSPTSSTSEQDVHVKGMPWEAGSATDGKYQYHPGGDPSREAKDAPSAVNVVIVPNVNLPKVCTGGLLLSNTLHATSVMIIQAGRGVLTKVCRSCTISTTNGERMATKTLVMRDTSKTFRSGFCAWHALRISSSQSCQFLGLAHCRFP
jgi:hypothetical protein